MKGSKKCVPNEILNDHLNLEEFPLYHRQPLLFFQKNYHLWLLAEHLMGRKWKWKTGNHNLSYDLASQLK